MIHIVVWASYANITDFRIKLQNKLWIIKQLMIPSIINFGEDPKSAMERIIREQIGASPSTIKLLDVQSYGDKHWDLCFVYDVTIDRVGKLSQDVESAAYFNRQKLPPEFRSDNLEVLETLEKKKEVARE